MPLSQVLGQMPYDGIFDLWNADYSFVQALVNNAHAGAITITAKGMIMMPCVYNANLAKLTAAASAATFNALIIRADGDISGLAAAGTSTVKAWVMVRGPAMVKDANIKLADAVGAAYSLSSVRTALLANCNPPIVLQAEATNKVVAPV